MKFEVLDHGYVEFIEAWGTGKAGTHFDKDGIPYRRDVEVGIIEAARQSTQGSFRGWAAHPCDCGWDPTDCGEDHSSECASKKNPGDGKLLKYLKSHRHDTPFEFSGMVIEVQAPIFVFREWHRHRTQSYNEMSARYTPLPDLYYLPDYEVIEERIKLASENRQATGVAELKDPEDIGFFLEALDQTYDKCEKVYQTALAKGIPKELARLIMPVGHYSRMRASANLRNWLHFLTLRMDPNAQWEIRQYAGAVAELIHRTFPLSYNLAFNEASKS